MAALSPAQSPPLVRMPMVLTPLDSTGLGMRRSPCAGRGLCRKRSPAGSAHHRRRILLYYRHSAGTSLSPVMDLDVEALKAKIETLKIEHRHLDEAISGLGESPPVNPVDLQRLKKRKLALRDLITR